MIRLLPLLIGFTFGAICCYDKSNIVKGAPPSYVFMLAWIFNYLALGHCWVKDMDSTLIYIANIVCSMLWMYFYNCKDNKQAALYSLLAFLLTLMFAYTTAKDIRCKLLLCCIIVWSIFAIMMNYDSL